MLPTIFSTSYDNLPVIKSNIQAENYSTMASVTGGVKSEKITTDDVILMYQD